MANDDGCSMMCVIEAEYLCLGEPSVCTRPVCGNSVVEAGEVCDDGNIDGGDGCEADCASAVFTGALAEGDPQWDRPDAVCGADGNPNRNYDLARFDWNGPVGTNLRFSVAWDGVDGFMHLFRLEDPFVPTNLALCLTGDDDLPGFDATGSQIDSYTTTADDGQLNVVMSTYGANTTGGWTLTVTLAP